MAQERKKRRIVLTSILKPVDDTRLFEKMGISLAGAGYDVFIVGFPSSRKPAHNNIHFIPLPFFHRLSIYRLRAKWQVLAKIFRLRPSIVVISTHELLLPVVILKVLTRTKVVYDIRENYYRNILYSDSFPLFIRRPLAAFVRFKEMITAPIVNHFLLAERGYVDEFSFHHSRWTVIENKAVNIPARTRKPGNQGVIHLLFSGTLAESTGVYLAIRLCQQLHQLDTQVTLTIIGYAALPLDRVKIKDAIKGHPYIKLIGGNQLVPHEAVAEQIMLADFGIISYPLARHIINSRPTKLYEYLSAGLPIIVESHWPWIAAHEDCRPFVFTDFTSPDLPKLLQELTNGSFYSMPAKDVTWASEAQKLIAVLEAL